MRAYQDLVSQPRQTPPAAEIEMPSSGATESPLSDRELEVLRQIATGKSNKQAALGLCISEQTVKNHLKHIFTKLEVRDRTSAIVIAMSNGWIESHDQSQKKAP